MKRIGTARRKTRSKLKKHFRKRGKVSLTDYFQSFIEGEKAKLSVEPSIHKGMYHPRFMGKVVTILKKNGTCYEVSLKDIKKIKTLIVHPVHLKKIQ